MAWSASGGFRQFFIDFHNNANSFWTPALPNLDLETHKVALYNNTGTPDFNDTAAHTAYNGAGGAWVTANEVSGTGYTAGGTTLTSTTVGNTGSSDGIMMWDAADVSWATATFSNAYGCLVYADALTAPVAKQGIIGVYFGGAFSVTAGTFTIQWAATGLMRADYA